MTGSTSGNPNRRRLLKTLGASVVGAGLAGCSGDGPGGAPDGGDDPGGTEDGDASGPTSPTASETASPTASGTTSPGDTAGGSGTLDLHLRVRGSRSNVDQFETLQTTFESIALRPSDGEAVSLSNPPTDFDLTELEPGEDVPLFEATVPAGVYEEMALVMPIQQATLADGSDPEFERTVPATTELGPLEVGTGASIMFSVIVALVRIAGGDTWTYTIGYSES